MASSLPILRFVLRTSASRLAARALPFGVGLLVVSAVVFSPNGLDPKDVARMAAGSPLFRVALWAAWLLACVPPTAALLRDRRVDVLRSLPIAPWRASLSTAVPIAILQLPWAALWIRGAGLAVGGRALLLGLVLSVLFSTRVAAVFEGAVLAAAASAVVLDSAPSVTLALAPLAALAIHRAWLRAPERPAATASWVRGPAPLALALAHHLRLVRRERVAVLRGVFVAALGGAFVALIARNQDRLSTNDLLPFLLAALAFPLVVAASGIGAPLVEADRSLDVLLRSNGATPSLRRGAVLVVGAGWGGIFGAAAFVAARAAVGLPLVLAPWFLAWGAAIGAATTVLARASARSAKRDDAGRVVALLAAFAVGLALLSSMLGEVAVLALAAVAIGAWALGLRRSRVHASGSGTLLEVRDVAKRFGGREVLRGVDLDVGRGSVTFVRGENGSGKSTLLRIVAGVLELDRGSVAIAGRSLQRDRVRALSEIGYAPDAGEMPDHLSVRELASLVAALRSAELVPEDEERLGLAPLAHERLASLSLGQRRRVGLLAALVGRPALLLLDEPTNGLDAAGLELLVDLLREQRERGGALVASHDLAFAARAADASHLLDEGAFRQNVVP